MRPVTLGSPSGSSDFERWALAAFRQIEQASNDTLRNDASSSGSALATVTGAAANQFVYFKSQTTTDFATVTPFARTLLADADAASMRASLGLPTSVPAFSVHKGFTNQGGQIYAQYNPVTWPTTIYDIGSHFASDAWTPPAGRVSLNATLFMLPEAGTFTTSEAVAAIFKNGVLFKACVAFGNTAYAGACVAVDDYANGTDAYSIQAYVGAGTSTYYIHGNTALSFFSGHWICP
jgi:hypothetical protein